MRPRDLLLWVALFAGPLAWFVDLVVSYALSPPAHHRSSVIGPWLVGAAAFAVAIGAGLLALALLRQLPPADRAGPRARRARFMALGAIALSAVSALLVLATAVPKWGLPPGAEP
jgi:MFS family permease